MPTVGSTTRPAHAVESYGLGQKNHHAVKITMPSGGPWRITKIGAWLAGTSRVSTVKLCIWRDTTETLVAESAAFDVADGGIPNLTAPSNYERNMSVPFEVEGGADLWVGFARDPSEAVQFTTRSSGTHRDKTGSGWPMNLDGYVVHSGDLGAYVADYETVNTAPNAPTNLSPTGDVTVHQGGSTVVSGTRNDPDSGDFITAYQVQTFVDGGAIIADSGKIDMSGQPTTFQRITASMPVTGAFYQWRARTWDRGGLAGPWSAKQRFKPNTPPNAPVNLQVDTDTLSPNFSGTFSDADPSGVAAGQQASVEVEVQLASSPNTVLWEPGFAANTNEQWTRAYIGAPLAYGTQYRWRARTTDGEAGIGAWSQWQYWTPLSPPGPNNNSPRNLNTKQQTLTPTLTVGHTGYQFKNEEIQVYAANDLASTLLWYKAYEGADYALTNTKGRTYAGTALNWGQVYYWRARIRDNAGASSPWSNLAPFYVNATPGMPTGMSPTGEEATSDTTPNLTATFEDPDRDTYGDTPNLFEYEVYVNDPVSLATSGSQASPGLVATVTSAALTNETRYKWRGRFRDQANQTGPWSDYHNFVVTSPPIVAEATDLSVTLANPSSATDDIIDTVSAHGFAVGNRVQFTALTGGAGLSVGTVYYVVGTSLGSTTFRVATTQNGTPINFTTNITAGTVVRLAGPVSPAPGKQPVLDWTFSSPGGKSQQSYWVRLYDLGPTGNNYSDEVLVWDSGIVLSTASSAQVPLDVVVTSHDYRWEVTVEDTDGLTTVLT